jgi:hypothetical protein
MRRSGVFASVLALGALSIAGCGSGGPSAQEKQFVAKANAICRQEMAALSKTPEPTTIAAALGFLPKAIALIERQSTRLEALPAPASKRGELQAALGGGRRLGALLTRFLHQLHSGSFEVTSFASVQSQSVALREQINTHFRKAGLKSCLASV